LGVSDVTVISSVPELFGVCLAGFAGHRPTACGHTPACVWLLLGGIKDRFFEAWTQHAFRFPVGRGQPASQLGQQDLFAGCGVAAWALSSPPFSQPRHLPLEP